MEGPCSNSYATTSLTIERSTNILTLVSQGVVAQTRWWHLFSTTMSTRSLSYFTRPVQVLFWSTSLLFSQAKDWKSLGFNYCTTSTASSNNAHNEAKHSEHWLNEPKNLCCSGVGRRHSCRNQKPAEGRDNVKQRDSELGLPGSWYGYRYHSQMSSFYPLAKGTEPWNRGHGERLWCKVKWKLVLDDTDTCSSFSIM